MSVRWDDWRGIDTMSGPVRRASKLWGRVVAVARRAGRMPPRGARGRPRPTGAMAIGVRPALVGLGNKKTPTA